MQSRELELAAMEAAALRVEEQERAAEHRFDQAYSAAEEAGSVDAVTTTPEFRDWLAARADTDAAWGRWAEAKDGQEADNDARAG